MVPDPPVQILANAGSSSPSAPVSIVANASASTPTGPAAVLGDVVTGTGLVVSGTPVFKGYYAPAATVDGKPSWQLAGVPVKTLRWSAADSAWIFTRADFGDAPFINSSAADSGAASPLAVVEWEDAIGGNDPLPTVTAALNPTAPGTIISAAGSSSPSAPVQIVSNSSASSPSAPVQITANGSAGSPATPPVAVAAMASAMEVVISDGAHTAYSGTYRFAGIHSGHYYYTRSGGGALVLLSDEEDPALVPGLVSAGWMFLAEWPTTDVGDVLIRNTDEQAYASPELHVDWHDQGDPSPTTLTITPLAGALAPAAPGQIVSNGSSSSPSAPPAVIP